MRQSGTSFFTRATVLTPPVKVTSLVSQGLPVVGGEGETGYTIRQPQSLGVVVFSALDLMANFVTGSTLV